MIGFVLGGGFESNLGWKPRGISTSSRMLVSGKGSDHWLCPDLYSYELELVDDDPDYPSVVILNVHF